VPTASEPKVDQQSDSSRNAPGSAYFIFCGHVSNSRRQQPLTDELSFGTDYREQTLERQIASSMGSSSATRRTMPSGRTDLYGVRRQKSCCTDLAVDFARPSRTRNAVAQCFATLKFAAAPFAARTRPRLLSNWLYIVLKNDMGWVP